MKSVNAAVSNAIRTAYDVNAVPRLTVEWNLNRYVDGVTADNDPAETDEGYDIEMFPIESIIKPHRPAAGILKARVDEARVADPYEAYDGTTRAARYYVGDTDDIYKYWTSPYPTDEDRQFPLHTDGITTVRPRVNYPGGVKANRIVVGFEDTWAAPDQYTIRVQTTEGGTWTVISTNPPLDAQGRVILNWNGSWATGNTPSEDTAALPTIYGIQVRVSSLKGGVDGTPLGTNSHLSLIEISARRVHDLTNYLISVSDSFEMGEKSVVYPIGTVTSNTATVTLFNGDGVFNAESVDSPYANLIGPHAKFTLDYLYTISGTTYTVPGFIMYGDQFTGQRSDAVSVDCKDYSKYFQEIIPRPTTYRNKTVGQIVWAICDAVGFVDYVINSDDITDDKKIPIWWCDGETTVWELFDELAKSTQTAIYFDSYGKLQVRPRTTAFKATAPVAWTVRGLDSGSELADIVTIDQSDELGTNFITVSYAQTDIDPIVNGQSKNQILWEPDGTVALRACPLLRDLAADGTIIRIPPKQTRIWQWEGMVNIQGEFIKYSGKGFRYYTYTETATPVTTYDRNGIPTGTTYTYTYTSPVAHTAYPKSQEAMERLNNKTPAKFRHRNHFTGGLKIEERGVWNSTPTAHNVEASGYSVRGIFNGVFNSNARGFAHRKGESRVVLNAEAKKMKKDSDLLVATRGASGDTGFTFYGTKMRFEKGSGTKTQKAGIVFNSNTNQENGYYVEINPTSKVGRGTRRALGNEVVLYTRKDGKFKAVSKGAPFAIVEGVDYEIDVKYVVTGANNDHNITVWVNGRKAIDETIVAPDKNTTGGRFGMFIRGDSRASYEYLYAIAGNEDRQPADDLSFLNKVEGGYTGNQLDREWVYRKRRKKNSNKHRTKYNISFYDEFGPIVHEVREFNVTFDPKPAISSRIYSGNTWSAAVPEYRADSFGARFYIANTGRQTAIINGEDTLAVANGQTTVNPMLAVIGRSISTKEAEKVEAKDEEQIRKNGEVKTEISGTWIQTKDMAQEIADWIAAHWAKGADEQTVEVFGNPLIEIGDIVAVEYPDLDMSASTHKYFVVAVENSFDTGLSTTLTLRRVV